MFMKASQKKSTFFMEHELHTHITLARNSYLDHHMLDHSIKDTCNMPFYENYSWRDHNQVAHRPE